MPTHTRFSPTEPRTSVERWVLALLAVVVLLPIVGVFIMLATGGTFFGVALGELRDACPQTRQPRPAGTTPFRRAIARSLFAVAKTTSA